jgi:tRNA threonylcarbamoyladenosine biosynthesis protein TsaE
MQRFEFGIGEVPAAAKWLIEQAATNDIWLFEGEMGAGKTTLIKAIAQEMSVLNHVQSPTFSIVNEYETQEGRIIYHFDCYRLKNEMEAYDIGVEEYLDSGELCWIEWPNKIVNLLPDNCFRLEIQKLSENKRVIVL